jgi:hypothetical protein
MRLLYILLPALFCLGLTLSGAAAQVKMPAVPAIEVTADEIPPPVTYEKPERVTVGAHINDILDVDMRTHSYRLDMYVWFRWRDPSLRPWETAEFMNAFDPADHVRTPVYEAPQAMPDGSLHMVVRHQGKFSSKFPMQAFPFDRQMLVAAMEDSVSDARDIVYIADRLEKGGAISINPEISLPGLVIERPRLEIRAFPYPTGFGDLAQAALQPYARVSFAVPVVRPVISAAIKVFLPTGLVIFCAGLVFFVHPSYVEGRLGVVITVLLTLVALQLTTASGLPDVDYLLLTDKIYVLSYLFVIAALMQVARTSPLARAGKHAEAIRSDRRALALFLALFAAGTGAVIHLGG